MNLFYSPHIFICLLVEPFLLWLQSFIFDFLLIDETNFTTHNLVSQGQGQGQSRSNALGSGREAQALRALNGSSHGGYFQHDGHTSSGRYNNTNTSAADQHQFSSSSYVGDNNRNRGGGRSISNGRSSTGTGQDRQGVGVDINQNVISLADVNWPKPERRPRFDSVGSAGSW